MKPIAIFYHTLFMGGNPIQPLPSAIPIITDQMNDLKQSGLLDQCDEFYIGVNGGDESLALSEKHLPSKAKRIMFGLQSKSEVPTIVAIEQWLPGHEDWNVLYFHSKGATHRVKDEYRTLWRKCMMNNLVKNWRQCVSDLDSGYDSVGCHWLTWTKFPQMPPKQSIWAGNFFWAKASFLLTLPSILDTIRVRISGVYSPESRFESEVWIGNGPCLPKVKDYHPAWPTLETERYVNTN